MVTPRTTRKEGKEARKEDSLTPSVRLRPLNDTPRTDGRTDGQICFPPHRQPFPRVFLLKTFSWHVASACLENYTAVKLVRDLTTRETNMNGQLTSITEFNFYSAPACETFNFSLPNLPQWSRPQFIIHIANLSISKVAW